MTSEIF